MKNNQDWLEPLDQGTWVTYDDQKVQKSNRAGILGFFLSIAGLAGYVLAFVPVFYIDIFSSSFPVYVLGGWSIAGLVSLISLVMNIQEGSRPHKGLATILSSLGVLIALAICLCLFVSIAW